MRPRIRSLKRSIANDSRAKQRRGLQIAKYLRNQVRKILANHRILRVTSIRVPAAEPGELAKIFPPARTIFTFSAGRSQPCDTHALADLQAPATLAQFFHDPHGLMSRHDKFFMLRQLSFDHVQIGPADRAAAHLQQNFTRGRRRLFNLFQPQRRGGNRSDFGKQHSFHDLDFAYTAPGESL